MDSLATTREVADYLKVKIQTLDAWASQGKGPAYVKAGGARRYDWNDVKAWLGIEPSGPAYRCSACRNPVASGDGHLIVSIDHAMLNGDADWGIFHDGCAHWGVPNPYLINIAAADTWPKLADWLAHLLEKEWAHNTDLSALLRKLGAAR